MRAVVVADGEPAHEDRLLAASADLLIAADGGAAWLGSTGLRPAVLVGDLDSVDPSTVARLSAAGTEVVRHPTEKDASDTELAVELACERGADRVVLLGALGGGRLDHEVANLLLLADPGFAARDLRIVRGGTLVRALVPGRRLTIEAGSGSTVTLLPVGGEVTGVTTRGLRYRLDGEPLGIGRSRGLSNEVVEPPASVSTRTGTLLVIENARDEGENQ